MNKSEIAEKVKFEQFMRDIADKRFTSYFTSENSELFWACWERAIAESQAPTVTLSQGGCSGTMPVYGAELGGGEPSPSPYTDHVSTEPLDVIRANECESTPSLTTSRFRALWNEIVRLRSGAAQEVSPSANFVSEIRPRPDDPSCHVCGARMVVKEWKCLSCKATTGVEEVSPLSEYEQQAAGFANYALEVKGLLTEEFGEHFPEDIPAVVEILAQTEDFLKRGKFGAEGDTRELKAALQAIVNWCRHPAHGGKYDLPKPLEPYLLQAEKVLGSD